MIYAVGDISGAHFNPAVTFGFFAARRLPGAEVAPYIGSQVVGAMRTRPKRASLPDRAPTGGAPLPAAT